MLRAAPTEAKVVRCEKHQARARAGHVIPAHICDRGRRDRGRRGELYKYACVNAASCDLGDATSLQLGVATIVLSPAPRHGALAEEVVAPAPDTTGRQHRAGVGVSSRDLGDVAGLQLLRHRALTEGVATPAPGPARRQHRAGVGVSSRDLGDAAGLQLYRHCALTDVVPTPALDPAGRQHRAGVVASSRDLGDAAGLQLGRHRAQTDVVATPAPAPAGR